MALASSTVARSQGDKDAALEIQREMAEIFADLAELFGNPSSIGAIYGLLFASPEPLSMEEIVESLGISTGTASQGLRRLVELEAIVSQKSEGERGDTICGEAGVEAFCRNVSGAATSTTAQPLRRADRPD
jgi:DNA-binding transcriptional regulator GbsR (MarR family)